MPQSSSPPRGTPFSHKRGNDDRLRRYNCFTRNGGNAILQHVGPEAKGSSPITGLTLLWVRNLFRGNVNNWQVSRKEAGHIFFKRRHGCEKGSYLISTSYINVDVHSLRLNHKTRSKHVAVLVFEQ